MGRGKATFKGPEGGTQDAPGGAEDFDRLLAGVELPGMALVEQSLDAPPAIADVASEVRAALEEIELPGGEVAIGVGSRGVGRVGEIVAALVEALHEAGARPFVIPAMGSHGASTAEGQAEVLRHLGVSEETVGCPVRATMDTAEVGRTASGVPAYMDKNAYEADAVIVVNRIKPHTAFRGPVESGPTKMLAIGLGKQRGGHAVHAAGWDEIHRTIPEVAGTIVGTGKVAFGLGVLETVGERPCRIVAIPAGELEEGERPLLEEAKRNLPRLPFEALDVLVVDEIGKNISGDGADPNVTGRFPTPYASGGPEVGRMVFLGLTEETGGNANGLGMADAVTERLASTMDRVSTYTNALTSTTSDPVRTPMVMPSDRLAISAALAMCAGVTLKEARIVRIENTLQLERFWVSEALLGEVEANQSIEVIDEASPMQFEEDGSLTGKAG